ncbi:hypothetical protein MLD38_039639 [Melastoma candidum]|uniref:Uncharacterized protein n=1 Tax=Melastoma candidum TaxID=119954 RepID=A0ACB9L436_9MYRT|nr:hypothetical protein MLD38_039639 [Melastoma candidum]
MAGHEVFVRFPANFPSNLRVLLVDADVAILKKMLEDCSYNVIACQSGEEALEQLRINKKGFDIVMSNLRLPGITGLQLLAETASMEIDSPLILFSDEPDFDTVLKGIEGGACDFLAKPIYASTLKMIWKHLLRKTGKEKATSYAPITPPFLHSNSQSNEQPDYNAMKRKRGSDSTDSCNSLDSSSLKENEQGQSSLIEAATTMKKPRMSWTTEAHNAFLDAISSLPPEKVLPKKIQEHMETKHGITGLTRQIIASHLQKHRDSMKKLGNRIPGDPGISCQATRYCAIAPPEFPSTSQNLPSTSWEMLSRPQAMTVPAYSQHMYQMDPQTNRLQRFLGNPFPQTATAGYHASPSSQPSLHQIPWNPSAGPMTREQLYSGVDSINSTIQATPINIYSTGMESHGQQLPLGAPCGVYNSNESCRSDVFPLPQGGEFVDQSMPATTLEKEEVDNWLTELSFEALYQDSVSW